MTFGKDSVSAEKVLCYTRVVQNI